MFHILLHTLCFQDILLVALLLLVWIEAYVHVNIELYKVSLQGRIIFVGHAVLCLDVNTCSAQLK